MPLLLLLTPAVIGLQVAADVTYAQTLAGALAPVLTALLFIPIRVLMKRMETNHDLAKEDVVELKRRLAEAEGAIRGDLRNGIKKSLDSIAEKMPDSPPEAGPPKVTE